MNPLDPALLAALPRYLVVEGVIGVGKTTLVQALASRLDARTVLEVFEENPFLARFYQDQARWAFSTETFFLLSRFQQQETFAQEDLLQRFSVSDYLFEKCRIFASQTLEPSELSMFDRFWSLMHRQIPQPDVVIWLHAPIPTVLERVRARARAMEAPMEAAYLTQLDEAYHAFFQGYDAQRLVTIDTTTLDFRDPLLVDRLLELLALGCRGAFPPAWFAPDAPTHPHRPRSTEPFLLTPPDSP